MNIREIARLNPHYFEINREERNYAAIFFAALCKIKNVQRFLKILAFDYDVGSDYGVYFEYAYMNILKRRLYESSYP
jgi:hypothetical protein